MSVRLVVEGLAKTFTMHLQGGLRLAVVEGARFVVEPGECVVLSAPSGAGKSSLLKMVYGNYAADAGSIRFQREDGATLDMARANPREVLALRRDVVGYVSQFLRALPRVPAVDVVAEPLVARGVGSEAARRTARDLLARLNLPERLWDLPPATFSGGEQQRVNIARGFATPHPVLLLDEPTASLDAANRDVVVELVAEKKRAGTALLGILHDAETRERVADRVVDVAAFAPQAAA